ncbi:MAG: hypothetical protein K5756_01010 [Clostridiales bacterium]|nr:hypothetical protein [Clostridiales bacterium]
MKKVLFISGILLLAAGIICLLISVFYYYSYHHVLDGSAELYHRLHNRAVKCLISGIVTEICGIITLAVRYKNF